MDFALDRYNDPPLLVSAEQAADDQHRYLCPHPQCRRPVYRAEGQIQRPHFKHFRNSGADDCPYFHSSSWEASPEGLRQEAARRRRQPALLAGLTRRGADVGWNLLLYVPPLDGVGAVARISEPAGVRTVGAQQLSPHGRRLAVRAQEGNYSVTILHAAGSVADRFEVAGLRRNVPNLFRFAETGGRRLATDASGAIEPVVLSATYLVVTHWEHPLGTVPPEVRQRFLGTDGSAQWSGTLLQLPGEESEGLRRWCAQHLRRRLTHPQPELTLSYPPHSLPLADETLEVPAGQKVILAVHGEPGAPAPGRIILWDARVQSPYQLFLGSSLPVFITFGPLRAGVYEVLVPEAPDLYLELRAVKLAPPALPEAAALQVQDAAGAALRDAPLFSEPAEELLQSVRAGRQRIAALRLPAGLPLTVRTRDSGVPPWREDELRPHGADLAAYEAEVAATLGHLLARPRVELVLDAGAFGHAELRDRARRESAGSALHLPRQLRVRLLWLLGAAHRAGPAVPARAQIPGRNRLTGPDRQLVEQILSKAAWPVKLLPQVRSAFRELTCHLGGGEA
jgi:hypothetical protein